MWYFNVFTYNEDQDVLPYCVDAVLKVFKDNCKIFILDDNNHPMDESIVDGIVKKDNCITYRKTTFERNHNLNGKECCLGMMEQYILNSNGDKEGVTVKLDPDTIITSYNIFEEFLNEPTNYMGSHRPGGIFSGLVYCIKNHILEKQLEILKMVDFPMNRGPEDVCLGLIASLLSMPEQPKIIRDWNPVTGGNATAWNYENEVNEMVAKVYFKNFDIITMGNWFLYKNLTKHDRIKPMQLIMNCFDKNLK